MEGRRPEWGGEKGRMYGFPRIVDMEYILIILLCYLWNKSINLWKKGRVKYSLSSISVIKIHLLVPVTKLAHL